MLHKEFVAPFMDRDFDCLALPKCPMFLVANNNEGTPCPVGDFL